MYPLDSGKLTGPYALRGRPHLGKTYYANDVDVLLVGKGNRWEKYPFPGSRGHTMYEYDDFVDCIPLSHSVSSTTPCKTYYHPSFNAPTRLQIAGGLGAIRMDGSTGSGAAGGKLFHGLMSTAGTNQGVIQLSEGMIMTLWSRFQWAAVPTVAEGCQYVLGLVTDMSDTSIIKMICSENSCIGFLQNSGGGGTFPGGFDPNWELGVWYTTKIVVNCANYSVQFGVKKAGDEYLMRDISHGTAINYTAPYALQFAVNSRAGGTNKFVYMDGWAYRIDYSELALR